MADVDWMILSNYSEAPPDSGLVYIIGGAWDTITVHAPLEGAPPNVVAAVQGYLTVRLKFHRAETDRDYRFTTVISDEDGEEVAKLEGGFRVERIRGLPTAWEQGTNLVLQLTGLGLPKFGVYDINLLLDGRHVGTRSFRVLKGY